MQDDAPIAVVTTTVGSAADASQLADLVLQARLAACVQVLQITSSYYWQGALHQDAEWRLECKTTTEAAQALRDMLARHHPYDVPELLVQTVQAERGYAQWVQEQTRRPV